MWRSTTPTKIPAAAAQRSSSICSSKRFLLASKRWPHPQQSPPRVRKKCPLPERPRSLPLSISNNKNPACSLGNGCSTFAEIPREAEEREIQAGAESVCPASPAGGWRGDSAIGGGQEGFHGGGPLAGPARGFAVSAGPASS